MLASTVVTGAWQYGPVKIGVWLAYLGLYRLSRQIRQEVLHQSALLALGIYTPLGLLGPFNANVVAFNLVGLALFGLPASGFFSVYILGGLVVVLFYLESVGGLLALAIAVVTLVIRLELAPKPARYARCIPFAIVPLGWLASPSSVAWRVTFWTDALAAFVAKPIFGLGPGMYFTTNGWPHAHNILLTTLAEGGLMGLLPLLYIVLVVTRRWVDLPTWAAALVAAYGIWSLVDEPLYFWGPGAMLFITLGVNE